MGQLLVETVSTIDRDDHENKEVSTVDSVVDCFNKLDITEKDNDKINLMIKTENEIQDSSSPEEKKAAEEENDDTTQSVIVEKQLKSADVKCFAEELNKEEKEDSCDENADAAEPQIEAATDESCDENTEVEQPRKEATVDESSDENASDDEVEYYTRGPCKVSSAHFGAVRYNPMNAAEMSPASPSFNLASLDLNPLTPDVGFETPPHQHDSPAYQPAYDQNGPTYQHGYNQDSPAYQHGYNQDSPAYQHGYNQDSPAYLGGYDNLNSPGYLNTEYGQQSSPLTEQNYGGGLDYCGQAPSHYGYNSNHVTSDYLTTLQNVVARNTASPSVSAPSPDNVRQVMDSLRNINPGELDYISPASPTSLDDIEAELALPSVATLDDLEAELALPSPLSSCSPSASPSSSPDCHDEAFLSSPSWAGQAVATFKTYCEAKALRSQVRNVVKQSYGDITSQDVDGDSVFMIVVCKPATTPGFYERVYALQESLALWRICCGCNAVLCGERGCGCGETAYRTPLSTTSVAGDTALSYAVHMSHPVAVVDYLLAGLSRNPRDAAKVFGNSHAFFCTHVPAYPRLISFL